MVAASYIYGSWLVDFEHEAKYIWADAEGYYMYLPAVMMYGGDFGEIPVRTEVHFKHYPGTEKYFTKYSYGVAVLEAPFFLGAYGSRIIQGFDPDVYDADDYSVALLLAACIYGVLGLFFLWRTLQRHFQNRWVSGLAIATIFLGTNLLHYMVRAPGMSHVYSFFIMSVLVWLTPKLYRAPTFKTYLWGGLLAGLIVLIRPTNGVLLLYPLLYGVTSWTGLGERFLFFKNHLPKLLLAAALAFVLWLPQIWYWHYLSGSIFIDPYSTESFKFWNRPLVGHVLFSVLNGYFIYNPVMLLPVLTTFFLLKKNQLNSWATLLIFALATYTFASWWCWWFAGSFGHRCYVELLPVLALPMGFFMKKLLGTEWNWLKISGLVLVALLVVYNFRLIMLYEPSWNSVHITWERYWVIFERAFLFWLR